MNYIENITVQHANRHTLAYSKEGWTPLRGQLVSTFDVRFPRILEWLWLDITIHIPHHIAPAMPWYNLRKASTAVQTAFPQYYQTQKFSLWHLEWFAKTPFLHEVKVTVIARIANDAIENIRFIIFALELFKF